jgi:hypothetical protein
MDMKKIVKAVGTGALAVGLSSLAGCGWIVQLGVAGTGVSNVGTNHTSRVQAQQVADNGVRFLAPVCVDIYGGRHAGPVFDANNPPAQAELSSGNSQYVFYASCGSVPAAYPSWAPINAPTSRVIW